MTKAKLKVLRILDGCPTGATEHNLVSCHDVSPATLYQLVEASLIQPEERTIRPPWSWKITWMTITKAGRSALNGHQRKDRQ